MKEAHFQRLDGLAAALLWIWIGLAASVWLLPLPAPWAAPGSEGLANLVRADWIAWRTDVLALVGFGVSLVVVWLPRFLNEVDDGGPIGALRLWTAAALAALLVTFANLAIVGPRLALAHASAPLDPTAWGNVANFARQFLIVRILLALGLAWGTAALPRRPVVKDPQGTTGASE